VSKSEASASIPPLFEPANAAKAPWAGPRWQVCKPETGSDLELEEDGNDEGPRPDRFFK
jgi:hypothetical protein